LRIHQQLVAINNTDNWMGDSVIKKGFPYSLPSIGLGTDPSVQAAVSPHVTKSYSRGYVAITFCHACGYIPSRRASPPLGRYQVILLGDRGT